MQTHVDSLGSGASLDQPNAFDIPTFCKRNNIGVTIAYKARKHGFVEFTKLFGKSVVTVEAEAKFRKLLREGKLVWPAEDGEPKPARKPPAPKRKRRLGSSPLREG
jgi:hypothetical protein